MGNRRKSRELALQALYQAEVCVETPFEHFTLLCDNFEADKKAISYAHALIEGVGVHGAEIDALIAKHAKNWRVGRMSIIDRNLIRIGVFEVLFRDDVPATVAINEAIEIAKRYSTDDAPSFINGILDAISNGQSQ
ncbi:MAG: transcription antitermination factor NusB [Proteobacteria bacterium]|nr:transcription antitermination factor NusB [Desulfobulbaceae bacterium]MBU4153203.1 transcription antitermination factor NusB [Pseudomonadota bacterium]